MLYADTSVQVKYHQPLVLDCPIYSGPAASVSWTGKWVWTEIFLPLKLWKSLSKYDFCYCRSGDVLLSRFNTFSNGTLYIEHALAEDSGEYTCSVTNAAGVSSMTFDLQVLSEFYNILCLCWQYVTLYHLGQLNIEYRMHILIFIILLLLFIPFYSNTLHRLF